jgi:glycosyltransferase involved in cell wall biosynthesis
VSKTLGICAVYKRHQYATGVYSFTENLLRGLAGMREKLSPAEKFDVTVFLGSQGIPWSNDQFTFRKLSDPLGRWPVETRVGMFDGRGYDGILFPNNFTPPIVRSRRAVTIIHDLHYRNLPEHWPLAKRTWLRLCHEVTLRRCDAVVAISEWVKSDILKHYGQRWESKVHTIWNPIAIERFSTQSEQRVTGGRPYILCTSADRPSKNLGALIRAFNLIRDRFPDHCLVLAGQLRSEYRGWRRQTSNAELPAAIELVKSLNLADRVVLTGFIPDEQLGALYRGASLFVLPSLFEGFGMTAVEALALGSPTLVSDLPVLREVTLNGAHYIPDPLDAHQLADQMVEILLRLESARPSDQLQTDIRHRFAPETIARQYQNLLLGES